MTEVVAVWMGDRRFMVKPRFAQECASFKLGDSYILEVGHQQSATKRMAFHATIADVYASLPDDIGDNFISVDHFRYWATIKCGFADRTDIPLKSKAAAAQMALALRALEPYAIVTVSNDVVTLYKAKSTKAGAMDGKTFSELVDKVLAFVADLIKVKPDELRKLHAKDKLNPALAPPEAQASAHDNGEDEQPPSPSSSAPTAEARAVEADPPPALKRRRLTLEQALRLLPDDQQDIFDVVVLASARDAPPDYHTQPRSVVVGGLRSAVKIGITPTFVGYPVGFVDGNGVTTYIGIDLHDDA